MGLDSIELVMEVEKAFDIKIPDSEAEKILTVGDFHNSVWNHLSNRHSNRCNSQILFYKLRSYFITTIGIERNSFRPDTLLNEIFPEENRRKKYSDFKSDLHLDLPKLILTKPWNNFLDNIGLISILGGLIYAIALIFFFSYSKWILLIPVAGIIITYIISELLNPKRVIIEPALVRDFAEKTLSMNYALITKDFGTNRKEVETVINHIIADKGGLDLDEITPEKKIGDDLGIT